MQLFLIQIVDDHFQDIIQFLTSRTTQESYTTQQKKQLVVRATDFTLIRGQLYKLGPDEILRRYVLEHERRRILEEAHAGVLCKKTYRAEGFNRRTMVTYSP